MTVPVVGDPACNDKYNPLHHIADSMICAGTEDGKKCFVIIFFSSEILRHSNILRELRLEVFNKVFFYLLRR